MNDKNEDVETKKTLPGICIMIDSYFSWHYENFLGHSDSTWNASMLARWRRLWRDCRLAVLTSGGLEQGGGGRRSLRLARTMLRSERVARCNLFSLMGPLSCPLEWRRFFFDDNRGCKSSRSARIWSARPSLSEESSSSCMFPPRYGMTCNRHRGKWSSVSVWELHWRYTVIPFLVYPQEKCSKVC